MRFGLKIVDGDFSLSECQTAVDAGKGHITGQKGGTEDVEGCGPAGEHQTGET